MKNNLWHTIKKQVAPIAASVAMTLTPSVAKGQDQSQEKSVNQTTQEQIINTSEQSASLNKIANEISPPNQRKLFSLFFLDRKFDEMVEPTIQSFLKAQEKAQKEGLSTFQFDKQTFDATNFELAKDKFAAYYRARTQFKKKYTFQNKTFSTESMFSQIEQIKAYNNINEEITQTKDAQTAILTHLIAVTTVASKHPSAPKSEYYSLVAERAKKYCELLKISGNPGVYLSNLQFTIPDFDFAAIFTKSADGHFTPNLLSSGGNIYLNNVSEDTLLGELAHAFRNKNNALGEAGQFVKDGLTDIIKGKNGFTSSSQTENYSQKGKMEYDTHEIVEPLLRGFIEGKINTIPELYYMLENRRKENGTSYAKAYGVQEKILQGKIDTIDKLIKEQGVSEELTKLREAAEKQLNNYQKTQRQKKERMQRSHSGGGHQ